MSLIKSTKVVHLLLVCLVVAPSVRSQAQTYSVLYRFHGADGSHPSGGLIRDSAGNLYGVTVNGGTANVGTVFKLDAKLDAAGSESVLYSFGDGGNADGRDPVLGLTQDPAGNLYGITFMGGNLGVGTVFRLDTAGNETVLYSFTFGNDGAFPDGRLIRDSAGNLYGITASGGAHHGPYSGGTIFLLDPTGKETILQSFHREPTGLTADGAGNFYGTTSSRFVSKGRIFKLDKKGKKTVLYRFAGGADGENPIGNLTLDAAGNLYGTTTAGGAANLGTVFKLDTTGAKTVLHSFAGGADGAVPLSGVIRDAAGNLYGTTNAGGTSNFGTVFKVDATGYESVLHTFAGDTDGAEPAGALIQDSAGNLYGATAFGGDATYGDGVVFKLTP